jgi:hypothetical protein
MTLRRTVRSFLLIIALGSTIVLVGGQTAGAQRPNQGSAPVTVVNPLPLPVTIAGGTIPEPIQFQTEVNMGVSNGAAGSVSFAVPADKRLVIEHAEAECGGLLVGQTILPHVFTSINGTVIRHSLTMSPAGLPGTGSGVFTQVAETVRWYADAGTLVQATMGRTGSGGNAQCVLGFSGYLVDVQSSVVF